MKMIVYFFGFYLMCAKCIAQVYTLDPLYECETIELKKGGDLELYSIDSFTRGKFVIDLDKMTFTDPVTILSQPEIIDIKKVTKLENNRIQIDLKKDNRYSPDLYYLQLDSMGDPLYLQQSEVIFKNYTSNPASLILHSECTRNLIVEIPYTAGDPAPDVALKKALETADFTDGDNSFQLEHGYLTWTSGKGKNAVEHKIRIDNAYVSTNSDNYYIQLTGKDNFGLSYSIAFYHSRKAYPAYNYIFFERIENGKWIAMWCF